jgi:plastocyanin
MFVFTIMLQQTFGQSGAVEQKIQPDKDTGTHQIIRIHYSGAVIPEVLTVKPGATVVWINDSKGAFEIQFEGKQVTLACKSPVHFTINDDGSFISDRIPNGSVASLCFIEKGEFNYVARKILSASPERLGDRERIQEFKGKIVVKSE